MDFKHDVKLQAGAPAGGTMTLDPAALYRRAMLTKIRLRQAIFRARHLAPDAAGARRTAV